MKKRSTKLSRAIIMGLCVLGAVPAAYAGSLEPSGPPAPTMKPLEQIPPTWDQRLAADDTGDPCNSARFKCVMGGEAVLDKETGLVWQRSPDTTKYNWSDAQTTCATQITGGRMGWRAPSLFELLTLVDPAKIGVNILTLPTGNPFSNIAKDDYYWTATTWGTQAGLAWQVNFNGLNVLAIATDFQDTQYYIPPCVRGEMNADSY